MNLLLEHLSTEKYMFREVLINCSVSSLISIKGMKGIDRIKEDYMACRGCQWAS